MRKNNLPVLAALCAAALIIPSVHAQPTNAPGAVPPPTAAQPRPNPQARLFTVRASIISLDRVMADLKRQDSDFEGHKQTAIDACAKAKEELMAVAKVAGIPIAPMRAPGQRP